MASAIPAQALGRKERERLAHRREILEAAERVFARKGYQGATVEAIAQEAEFGVGTLYNFFDSKEHLYTECLTLMVRDFLAKLEHQVMAEDDPVKAIERLIELRLAHFEEHRAFVRVFFEAIPGSHLDPARALPPHFRTLYRRTVQAVSAIFSRAIEAGYFPGLDPLTLTLSLHGIITAFVVHWTREEPTEPLAQRAAKLKELFLGRLGGIPMAGTSAASQEPDL
jgi:AcrR family transcriptional regulator